MSLDIEKSGGAAGGGGGGNNFPGKLTIYVRVCYILAAFGGLMFGYDIGISGGVTSMDDFLKEYFPRVYERKQHAKEDNYCKYDDQRLQLFTSSLYLAAIFASFIASLFCSKFGRKPTILVASILYIIGVVLSSAAQDIIMLIFGRIFLGFGVGFGNEAVPLFSSEIAPAKHRGAVNILFQLAITIGIFVANLVNFSASSLHPYGYRLSLGLAGVPALILLIGSLIITETPSSLLEQGKEAQALNTLKKIRGIGAVEAEFEQIKTGSQAAKEAHRTPFKNLLTKATIPPLTIAILMQVFQQFTGINAIMFYAPVLFQTIGFKNNAALLSAVITGIVNVCSTLISVYAVDKTGRRKLLLGGCVLMFITQVAIGLILVLNLTATGTLAKPLAVTVVVLVCVFVMAFAWSWGPLGWLIPSETFPLETRTSGFAFAVSSNMLFTFIIAQVFLSMMCHMKAWIFFFFGGWVVVMGVFVVFLLPETKNVPIDLMRDEVWKKHKVWAKFMD